MKLAFTKSGGSNPAKYDRLDIITDNGPLAPIDCPKQGIIPHDMVHFAVESEVASVGFLGLAAAGSAGFTTGNDDAHARAVERLVETVQAEAWAAQAFAVDDFIGLYNLTCEARGDTPLAIDAESLAAIRARVSRLTGEWQALPPGDALVLRLNVPTSG
jgi:hypothetical protein